MTIKPLGNGQYRVSDGGRQRLAWVAGPPSARWVFLDGHVYLINGVGSHLTRTLASATARVSSLNDSRPLFSPMPATVTAVHVVPGQRVARGDVLIVLEAMKMELPITAPRDGIVKSVGCRVRDLVKPDTLLVEFE